MSSKLKKRFNDRQAHNGYIESPHYNEVSGYYGEDKRNLPSTMTNPKRVEAYLNKIIEADLPDNELHKGVSTYRLQVLKEAYKRAMTDPEQEITIKCIKRDCGKIFMPETICPECGTRQIAKNVVPDILRSKTTILCKLVDKIAPNLQNMTHQIDIQLSVNKVATTLIGIIMRYVPEEIKHEALIEVRSELSAFVSAAEMEELPDDVSKDIEERIVQKRAITIQGSDSDRCIEVVAGSDRTKGIHE